MEMHEQEAENWQFAARGGQSDLAGYPQVQPHPGYPPRAAKWIKAVPEAGASGAPAVAAAMRWEQRDCDCSQRRLRGVTEEDKRAMEGWRTPRGYMTRWVDGHDLLVKGDVNCPIYGDAVVQEQATQSYSRACSLCPVFECCFCHGRARVAGLFLLLGTRTVAVAASCRRD